MGEPSPRADDLALLQRSSAAVAEQPIIERGSLSISQQEVFSCRACCTDLVARHEAIWKLLEGAAAPNRPSATISRLVGFRDRQGQGRLPVSNVHISQSNVSELDLPKHPEHGNQPRPSWPHCPGGRGCHMGCRASPRLPLVAFPRLFSGDHSPVPGHACSLSSSVRGCFVHSCPSSTCFLFASMRYLNPLR